MFTVQRRYRVYFSWIHREREKKYERWSWNSEQTTHKKSKRAPMTCVSVCNVHSARTFLSVCLFRFLYIQVLMLYQKATTIKRRNCFFERKKRTHVQFTTFGICISWCSWSNMVFFCFFCLLTKIAYTKTVSATWGEKNNPTQRPIEVKEKKVIAKQVERCCTMPFWRDAIYRLQPVNFRIDVCEL